MLITPLLETTYKIQKQLAEEAQHDIERYVENSQSIVREVETQSGFKFKYGTMQGGQLEPLVAREVSNTGD